MVLPRVKATLALVMAPLAWKPPTTLAIDLKTKFELDPVMVTAPVMLQLFRRTLQPPADRPETSSVAMVTPVQVYVNADGEEQTKDSAQHKYGSDSSSPTTATGVMALGQRYKTSGKTT
jgi:hypothetical protein